MKNFINIQNQNLPIKLPKSGNNFQVPDTYFDSFTVSIMEAIQAQDFLKTLPTSNVYSVPVAYFKNFKIDGKTKKKSTIFSWVRKSYTIAAGVAILIISTCMLLQINFNTSNSNIIVSEWQQIPLEEINNYIANNIDDFENEMIVKSNTIHKNTITEPTNVSAKEATDFLQEMNEIEL